MRLDAFALALLLPVTTACLIGAEPARPSRHVPQRFSDLAEPLPLEEVVPSAPEAPDGPAEQKRQLRKLVARVELNAPSRRTFLLRATLPVSYVDAAEGQDESSSPEADLSRLSVVNHDQGRSLIPAQVQIVARRPDGRPDVIEVLAPVELAARERPGSRVRFNVVERPEASEGAEQAQAPSLPPATSFEQRRKVGQLLDPGGDAVFELRCEDVFGNHYSVDLSAGASSPGFGSLRVLEEGPWRRRTRLAAVLMPTHESGEGPPLPHMMGVHAFRTEVSGDARLTLDLRVHCGLLSGRRLPEPGEEPVGIVYWKSLELVLPRGWNVRPLAADPFFGPMRKEGETTIIPLVRANDDGSLHVMGPGMQFQRRLSLSTEPQDQREAPLLEGLAFALSGHGLFEWSSDEGGRYFPQRTSLAPFDTYARSGSVGLAGLRAQLAGEFGARLALVTSGQANADDVVAQVMGWAHPWLYKYGGTTGGAGIQFLEGHKTLGAASASGLGQIALVHRMNVSRQREAAWDRMGDPVGYHAWLDVADDRVATHFRAHGGLLPDALRLPAHGGAPASEQVMQVHRRTLRPDYDQGDPHLPRGSFPNTDDNLWAWAPHDGQHYVRWSKNAKALVWLANDPLARDDLRLSAELCHLWLHESKGPGDKVGDLAGLENHVRVHPNEGAWLGREAAWGIDVACAAYSVLEPAWRERQRSWLTRIARALVAAATPGGVIQRNSNPKILGHDHYDATQAFETFFLLNAMRCLNESVLREVEPELFEALTLLHRRTVDYLFFGPPWLEFGPQGAGSPAGSFAVGWADGYQRAPFSDVEAWGADYLPADGRSTRGEGLHGWQALEYAALLSDPELGQGLDNRYDRRALKYGGSRDHARQLWNELWASTSRRTSDNSSGWMGMAARIARELDRGRSER